MKRCPLLGLLVLCGAVSGWAEATNRISVEALRQVRLPDVALESVKAIVPGAQNRPKGAAYIEVKGIIGGHIHFELLLPEAWNERLVMGGGGGFVGTVQNVARDSVNQGYATVGTDTGHQSEPVYLAGWALDDLEAKVNFGYLAVHRTAEVAKALARSYYGADARHSYFVGCSRGGGQAMMEAQRYPRDFDGIVAGAPAFNWTGLAATMVSIAKALYPDPAHLDRTVLTKEALQKLQAGILEQCDAQDGLKDGVIQDPASVHFDLSKVAGLTGEQRQAIEAIYRGARNGKGTIYPGFAPPAECVPDQWVAWLTGPVPAFAKDHAADLTFAFGTQVFKYLVFNQPDWDYATYDFSNFDRDARLAASFLNATSPDLDAFKLRKGKLLLWHGWADPALPAQGTVDYYRQVQAHDGRAGDYCRLFMVPGCLHCGGGPGAAEVDWLSVIVDWVERDKAPDKLIASKRENGKVVMTRPLYPYPEYAAFKGSGDTNSADSFELKH
ncbi:MAG TPA: tannase/feruloyl esterase family alpha/beta hydrolase [Candidatus Binatia bacterium]|nr:tannase/feruloyl esterase family alpha/beta hydrolase [Candidatus Binatia bacterium]